MASIHAQDPQLQAQSHQQQTGQQQLDAAFPAPPDYYSLFTDANLGRLDSISKDAALEDAELKFLVAPPAPACGTYAMFGRTWRVDDEPVSLSEQKTKQLYPEGPIDRVAELKRLNHTVVFEFLELVDILIKDPSHFGTKSERIHDIFINAHHLINEYRGHQAKETLKLMLQQQIESKRLATENILAKCEELEQTIKQLKLEAAEKRALLEATTSQPQEPAASRTGSNAGPNDGNGDGDGDGDGDNSKLPDKQEEARVISAGISSIVEMVRNTSK